MLQLCHFTNDFQLVHLLHDRILDIDLINQSYDLDRRKDTLVVSFKNLISLGYNEKDLKEVLYVSCNLTQGNEDVEGIEAASVIIWVEQLSWISHALSETVDVQLLSS